MWEFFVSSQVAPVLSERSVWVPKKLSLSKMRSELQGEIKLSLDQMVACLMPSQL